MSALGTIGEGINVLPTELLIEIFEFALLGHYHHRIRNLLIVCKRWRDVIINSPDLWTPIHLVLRRVSDRFINAYYDACIERSRDKYLYITVDASNYINYVLPFFKSMLSSKKRKAALSRWRVLHIRTPKYLPDLSRAFDPFDHMFQLQAPNLISLKIIESVESVDPEIRDITRFVTGTSITSVTVTSWKIACRFRPRFAHIKSLDFTYAPRWGAIIDHFNPLYEMPLLESLILRLSYWCNMAGYTPNKGVFLPRLRELGIQGAIGSKALEYFNLPNLHRLTLIGNSPILRDLFLPFGLASKPQELFWERSGGDSEYKFDSAFMAEFRRLVLTYSTIKTMKVPPAAINPLMRMIKGVPRHLRLPIEVLNTWMLDDNSMMINVIVIVK